MKGQLKVRTPAEYLARIKEPRRAELSALDALIRKAAPNLEPFICSGMLGYGRYHYKYASGREGDSCRVGLASNANYISLYICACDEQGYIPERYKSALPKARIGRACVRFKHLSDLDPSALSKMIREGAAAKGKT